MSGIGSCSACGATFIGGHACPKPERELAKLRADLASVTADLEDERRAHEVMRNCHGAACTALDTARAQLREVAPIVRAAVAYVRTPACDYSADRELLYRLGAAVAACDPKMLEGLDDE